MSFLSQFCGAVVLTKWVLQVNMYVVEKILKTRKLARRPREYLVAWDGYGSEDNSWEPAANLHPDLKRAFNDEVKARKKRPTPSRARLPAAAAAASPATPATVGTGQSLGLIGMGATPTSASTSAMEPPTATKPLPPPSLGALPKEAAAAAPASISVDDVIVVDDDADNVNSSLLSEGANSPIVINLVSDSEDEAPEPAVAASAAKAKGLVVKTEIVDGQRTLSPWFASIAASAAPKGGRFLFLSGLARARLSTPHSLPLFTFASFFTSVCCLSPSLVQLTLLPSSLPTRSKSPPPAPSHTPTTTVPATGAASKAKAKAASASPYPMKEVKGEVYGDGEVELTAMSGPEVLVDYPHAREHCGKNPFGTMVGPLSSFLGLISPIIQILSIVSFEPHDALG